MRKIKSLSSLGVSKDSRIVIFVAHPDDETVFLSGFMQKCLKSKADLKVVCVSDGAKSTLKSGLKSSDSLKEVRKKELKKALDVLGVADYHHARFRDGQCERDCDAICKFMRDITEEFQPDFIVSLEPNGIYGHPDHMVISRLSTDLSREFNTKLIYATVDNRYRVNPRTIKFIGKRVKAIDPSYKLVLTPIESLRKLQAIRSHRSQLLINIRPSLSEIQSSYTIIRQEFLYPMDGAEKVK